MPLEFVFHIDSERISIADPSTGYRLDVTNRAVVRDGDGLLLALGKGGDEMLAQAERRRGQKGAGSRTCSLFGVDGSELIYEIKVLEHLTQRLHGQFQEAHPIRYFAAKLIDRFDYSMSILGYKMFPEGRRVALEQTIQAHLRLRRLTINGRAVQIPVWRRRIEFWSRRLLVRIVPLAAVVVGYLFGPRAITSRPAALFAYLVAILGFSYYGGRLLWSLFAREVVPVDYRLCMLKGRRRRLSRFDRWLAQAVWKDSAGC
jgi:hypothetical protein